MFESINTYNDWKYNVSEQKLQLVSTYQSPTEPVLFQAKYSDAYVFINEVRFGELSFTERAALDQNQVFHLINAKMNETNAIALCQSSLLSDTPVEVPEDSNVEIPTIKMKKNGETKDVSILEAESLANEGWTPVKTDYRKYPIVVDANTYEIQFTIYETEVSTYLDRGYKIINLVR